MVKPIFFHEWREFGAITIYISHNKKNSPSPKALDSKGSQMGQLIKILFAIVVIGVIGMVFYVSFATLTPDTEIKTLPVILNEN